MGNQKREETIQMIKKHCLISLHSYNHYDESLCIVSFMISKYLPIYKPQILVIWLYLAKFSKNAYKIPDLQMHITDIFIVYFKCSFLKHLIFFIFISIWSLLRIWLLTLKYELLFSIIWFLSLSKELKNILQNLII